MKLSEFQPPTGQRTVNGKGRKLEDMPKKSSRARRLRRKLHAMSTRFLEALGS